MFGFGKAIACPLTRYCTGLDENLLSAANSVMSDRSSEVDKRASILALLIMAASGHLVSRSLRWDDGDLWEGSRRYLRETNLDVITAEASVWIAFLMAQFRKNEKDKRIFERIGHLTTSTAALITLKMIASRTGFDFTYRAQESRKLYLQALKDHTLFEAFATVVLRSIGCKSLAEPLKPNGPQNILAPERTPISMQVGVFFSTMPQGYYDTFKSMLREASDHFPQDG